MPCPHNEITIVQRSQRQSAVAAAAYQSGEKLFCEYERTSHTRAISAYCRSTQAATAEGSAIPTGSLSLEQDRKSVV